MDKLSGAELIAELVEALEEESLAREAIQLTGTDDEYTDTLLHKAFDAVKRAEVCLRG